jgi:endonuclease/exonuclease/phosphatase family metal-dependent hydrolase
VTDRVRIATWNCFGVPAGVFGWLFDEPHLPERFRSAQIARALAPYDVICVQESFIDHVSDFFEELAELLGMNLWHDRMLPHVRERSPFGGGLAILSPQPLDVHFEIFDVRPSGMDAMACKGFATCDLKTRNGSGYRIVNLHMQADDPPDQPAIYGHARAAQLAKLLDSLDGAVDPRPTVVCGDLNVREGSDEYHQVLRPSMRDRGFVDVAEGLGLVTYAPARNALLARVDPTAADARIDYVWTRDADGRRWRVVTEPQLILTEPLHEPTSDDEPRSIPLFASDHFGIGVELDLEGG